MCALQAKSDIGGSIYLILQYLMLPQSTERGSMPKGGRNNCGELRRAMIN